MEPRSDGRSADDADHEPLESYLRRAVTDGQHFFKSRKIATDIDLSPSEIGSRFSRLQESSTELEISKWGYTGGTTWYVELES